MDNLLGLREDMKLLYRSGYGWLHPFTQCILQRRLKFIKSNIPVDISICNSYLRISDNRQVSSFYISTGLIQFLLYIFRFIQNDNGDFADYSNQPDVYGNSEEIGPRGREYYPDIGI